MCENNPNKYERQTKCSVLCGFDLITLFIIRVHARLAQAVGNNRNNQTKRRGAAFPLSLLPASSSAYLFFDAGADATGVEVSSLLVASTLSPWRKHRFKPSRLLSILATSAHDIVCALIVECAATKAFCF